jgi:ADP-heptose:LPS heptosyltransferase
MHILITRFSSLGDIVIHSSVASWIKKIYPDIVITFATSKEFTSLIKNHPHIDSVIGHEKQKGIKDLIELRSLVRKIHLEKPIDFIIDLHGTTRSFMLKLLNPDIPCLNLDKRRLERSLLINLKINLLKNEKSLHDRTIYDYQSFLNSKYNRFEFEQFIKDYEDIDGSLTCGPRTETYSMDITSLEKYIVVAPVASFAPKRWPLENYKVVLEQFLNSNHFNGYGAVVVGGPNDSYLDLFNQLEEKYPNRFYNLKGKTSLQQTRSVIKNASFLVGNDTGMGHIAESFGVNVLTIFGPTSENFGFSPHRKDSHALSSKIWCRPCSATGKKKCFRSKQYCMENVTIEEVFSKLKEALREK